MLLYFLLAVFAIIDVATLLLLSNYIGNLPTLGVVLVSTFLGLFSCNKLLHKFSDTQRIRTEEIGTHRSGQDKLYMVTEVTLLLLSLFFFIFPGLLSDVLAYLVLVPVIRGKVRELVRWFQKVSRDFSTEGA